MSKKYFMVLLCIVLEDVRTIFGVILRQTYLFSAFIFGAIFENQEK